MKTKKDIVNDVDRLLGGRRVGILMIHNPPSGDVDDWFEEVIKLREMEEDVRGAIELLHKAIKFSRLEIFVKNGVPDRVKVAREF